MGHDELQKCKIGPGWGLARRHQDRQQQRVISFPVTGILDPPSNALATLKRPFGG